MVIFLLLFYASITSSQEYEQHSPIRSILEDIGISGENLMTIYGDLWHSQISRQECRGMCKAMDECMAYTWTKDKNGTCSLKSTVDKLLLKMDAISGVFLNVTEAKQHVKSFDRSQSAMAPFLAQLDCAKAFANDEGYLNSIKRVVENYDERQLEMSCDAIKRRNYFPFYLNSKEEAEFPIAFARMVYKDYLFLESELAAEYAPQNFYCFSIDLTAPNLFKNQIRQLASCFPNVLVADPEFNMTSNGANLNLASVECLKVLAKHPWNYVTVLQLKISMKKHLRHVLLWIYDKNNQIKGDDAVEEIREVYGHDSIGRMTVFRWLKKFRNGDKNGDDLEDDPRSGRPSKFNEKSSRNVDPNGRNLELEWAKGAHESTLSRAMVDFMLNALDLTKFMEQLEYDESRFGIDELFFQTLHTDKNINAPGGFTHSCLDQGIELEYATRYNVWVWFQDYSGPCQSRLWRHHTCIFGMEDLHRLAELPFLFVNKMIPSYDLGAIACWHDHMFNRTHLEQPTTKNLNPDFYLSMPHVRYHREKKEKGYVDMTKFDCNFKYDRCWTNLSCKDKKGYDRG